MEFKDKDQLVDETFSRIKEKLDVDDSSGEPLRNIIEAIMHEMSLQYWQIQQNYDNSFIDTAYGDGLTEIVKVLGITRNDASKASGEVVFYRETPAPINYRILAGTLVETFPNAEGESVRFETTSDVTLLQGQTSVIAPIVAIEAGISGNIIANTISVINNPPTGIEAVKNDIATVGGEDEESDEVLRERAKRALDSKGNATIDALKVKIANVSGIKSVSISDLARGIGTVDILVLGETLPMPSTKMTELNNIVKQTAAAGIDVQIIEPTIKTINVDVILTLASGVKIEDVDSQALDAIDKYFSTIVIGETFYRNQLSKEVLNSHEGILDINITSPSTNITATEKEIIIKGTVTVG